MKCKNNCCIFYNRDECTEIRLHNSKCFGYMKPETNADRIRSMSDEELYKVIDLNYILDSFIENYSYNAKIKDIIMDWLKQEVEQMPAKLYENKCNKCGKEQPENQLLTAKHGITIYDCNLECPCGGKFVLWVNGKPLSPYVEHE